METRQVKVRTAQARNYIMNNEIVDEPAKYEMGIFHIWEQYREGDYSKTYAIIELENGTVNRFELEDITFTGKPVGANFFEDGLEFEVE